MATHSSTLAWKIPWTEEPDRLQSLGLQRVGHDWETSLSRETSQPRDRTLVSFIAGGFFTIWATEKSLNWARPMKVALSCLTLCDPMDYTVHGILQARILEWVAVPFSRVSSQSRDRTQVSWVGGGSFTSWTTREAQEYWSGCPLPFPGDLPDPGIELGSPALQVDPLPAELWERGRKL